MTSANGGEGRGRSRRRPRASWAPNVYMHVQELPLLFTWLPYVCLIYVLLAETDNNEDGIEKVFDKSLRTVNEDFLTAFRKMLLLTID